MSYKVLKTIQYSIDGRPVPKERPRHTIGNLPRLATSVFSLFKRNPKISIGDFTKRFIAIVNKFTKNSHSTIYTPTKTKQYEQYVGLLSKSQINKRALELDLRDGKIKDYMITIHINLFFKDKRVGDVDNYTKSILDGMHTIFDDDKQVKKVIVEKFIKEDNDGKKITEKDERADIKLEILDMSVYYNNKPKHTKKKTTNN